MIRLALAMRTANRGPKAPNYVGRTVRRLLDQGVTGSDLHLCVTAPDARWLTRELDGAAVTLHVPDRKLTPNENGLEMIRRVDPATYDWILLLEDDLEFCADFQGSVARWLEDHGRSDRHVFQFFGFANPPRRVAAYDVPLKQLRASQAIALRMADAQHFLAWGDANLTTWRTRTPWGSTKGDATIAWDKFLACWSLVHWPQAPGVQSHPHFVRHIGLKGSLHGRTVANDRFFSGPTWSYQSSVAA